MNKVHYILLLIFALSFSLTAQLGSSEQRAVDSLDKIIFRQKNDTAVIYYEHIKDNYIVWWDPVRSLKSQRSLLELAKKTKHIYSILRIYSNYERTLWVLAQREKDLAQKERYLVSADSMLNIHLELCLNRFKDETLIIVAGDPIGRWRKLSEVSLRKKEEYFKKETDGYMMLVNKYDLKKYPKHFINVMFGMAVAYQNQLKTAGAVKYYLMLAEYSDSLKDYDKATEFYNNLGFAYFADGNFGAAQRYYFLSLRSTEKLPADSFTVTERHKERIANKGITFTNIANIFLLQKNYTISIDYYKKSLQSFLDAEEHEYYISFVTRIGTIYATMNQIDSAENYLHKIKKLTYLLKDNTKLVNHEIRINGLTGYIFAQKKQYRDAIRHALTVVKLSDQTNNMNAQMQAYESIGNYYVLNNEPQKGIHYYNKQLTFRAQLGGWVEKTLSKIYINKGKAFIKLNSPDSAIANLLLAKASAEKVNIKLEMNSVYQSLSEAYILANKMSDAIFYLKKHIQYKDSLVGDQVTQQVTSIGLKYESDMKLIEEKSIRDKQQLENLKKEAEQAQQKKILMIIIFSVSLLVIVAAFSLFKINKANALLKSQNTVIEEQRNLVVHQKHIVEEKNKEITDSIQYAKRIQTALIQTQPHFESNFNDHFIFFKPKDIVSGDFYWSAVQNEHLYVAACDCTGHGVPGAFMSLLNISFLNEAVVQKKLIEPNKVFDFVKTSLVTNLSFEDSKDGMDACLVHINKNTRTITYSAANNKPILIRNNELIELPCDKMPVGKSYSESEFTLYSIDYKTNDILYMFTDGYKDQFGGKENKKLNSKVFKKLLLEFSPFNFSIQKEKLKDFFAEWRGSVEQTDDVCVIGLKL